MAVSLKVADPTVVGVAVWGLAAIGALVLLRKYFSGAVL
jgi:hypothetical protein